MRITRAPEHRNSTKSNLEHFWFCATSDGDDAHFRMNFRFLSQRAASLLLAATGWGGIVCVTHESNENWKRIWIVCGCVCDVVCMFCLVCLVDASMRCTPTNSCSCRTTQLGKTVACTTSHHQQKIKCNAKWWMRRCLSLYTFHPFNGFLHLHNPPKIVSFPFKRCFLPGDSPKSLCLHLRRRCHSPYTAHVFISNLSRCHRSSST